MTAFVRHVMKVEGNKTWPNGFVEKANVELEMMTDGTVRWTNFEMALSENAKREE